MLSNITNTIDFQNAVIFLLSILTIGLVSLCIYLIATLKDLRVTIEKTNSILDESEKTVQKTNLILDDVEKITYAISNPLSAVTNLLGAVTAFRSGRYEAQQKELIK